MCPQPPSACTLLTGSSVAQHACVFLALQDESTAEITFYMKGADVAMSTIVQYNDWLEEEVTRRRFVRFSEQMGKQGPVPSLCTRASLG